MKRTLLFIAGALLITSGLNAQITLNQAGYTSSPIGTDSLKVTAAASTFPSFAPATNHSWDLSTLTDSAATLLDYHVIAVSPATFADSNMYSLGANAYQGNLQSAIAAAGLLQYGINIQDVKYGLSATDTIYIPAQVSTFTATHTVIAFPAHQISSWGSVYESDFNYNVTYSPPLYVHAPGIIKSYYTETDSVIGWGQMKIKTATGTASGNMDVLQVRVQVTRTDSFYLNNGTTDPAIPTLLTLLGATQGQVTKTYTQNFYRANEVTPLAMVTFSDSANTTPTQATTHVQRLAPPTAVANVINEASVNIYPNPISGNDFISVDMPTTTGEWKYELVNIKGEVISSHVQELNQNQAQSHISLHAPSVPGIYYVRILNDGKQVMVKSIQVN